jgi:hypothetical protein
MQNFTLPQISILPNYIDTILQKPESKRKDSGGCIEVESGNGGTMAKEKGP